MRRPPPARRLSRKTTARPAHARAGRVGRPRPTSGRDHRRAGHLAHPACEDFDTPRRCAPHRLNHRIRWSPRAPGVRRYRCAPQRIRRSPWAPGLRRYRYAPERLRRSPCAPGPRRYRCGPQRLRWSSRDRAPGRGPVSRPGSPTSESDHPRAGHLAHPAHEDFDTPRRCAPQRLNHRIHWSPREPGPRRYRCASQRIRRPSIRTAAMTRKPRCTWAHRGFRRDRTQWSCSPIRWTWIMLVEPTVPGGAPATMTTTSPTLRRPILRSWWSTWSIM